MILSISSETIKMNKKILFAALSFLLIAFSGCQAIGDIFKTGVWFGVILVVGIIVLIIYLVTKSKS
jgi:hypothetical protein